MNTSEIAKERMRGLFLVAVIALASLIPPSAKALTLAQPWSDEEDTPYEYALRGNGSGLRWINPVVTEYNPAGGESDPVPHVQYGNWSWQERTGKPISYSGTTTSIGGGASLRVTVRWIDAFQMYDMRGDFFTKAVTVKFYYLETGEIVGAVIYLNSTIWGGEGAEQRQVIYTHELGHALGVVHSDISTDVLYTYANGTYALSYNDVHRAEYEDLVCWVELTRENDLYIPAAGGMSALLRFDGVDRWTLDRYAPSAGTCSTVTMDDERDLHFTDVRTLGASYTNVQLEWISGDTWSLRYAE